MGKLLPVPATPDPDMLPGQPNPGAHRTRLTRRQFLAASSALSAGAAVGGVPALALTGLRVERLPDDQMATRQTILVVLDGARWLITPRAFGPRARLRHDETGEGHTLTLDKAEYPGTGFSAGFKAKLSKAGADWQIAIDFDACKRKRAFKLADWIGMDERPDHPSTYRAPLRAGLGAIPIGARALLRANQYAIEVAFDAAFTATFTSPVGLGFSAPRLTMSQAQFRPAASLTASAASLAAAAAPAPDGPFTNITFRHVGAQDAALALCAVSHGQQAALTQMSRTMLEMSGFGHAAKDALLELSGSTDGLIPAAALTLGRTGQTGGVRIQLASWTLGARLNTFSRSRVLRATIADARAVEGENCTLVIAPLPDHALVLPLTDAPLRRIVLDAQLLDAHVPVPGASGASFSFYRTGVRISFGQPPDSAAPAGCDANWHIGLPESHFATLLEAARLSLRRSADCFNLDFGFRNYSLLVNRKGTRTAQRWSYEEPCRSGAAWPRLLVHFPPQHEFEEVFEGPPVAGKQNTLGVPAVTADAGIDKTRPKPTGRRKLDGWIGPDLARTRLAGPSRLVFQARAKLALSREPVFVALTIESITRWEELDLVVNQRALKRNATLQDQLDVAGILPADSRRVVLDKVRKLALGGHDGQPADEETALEPIYRMLVSPDASAKFTTPAAPPHPTHPILWSAELANEGAVAVRALAARGLDFGYIGRAGDYAAPDFDLEFTGSLSANDLRELVGMQSVFGLAALRRLIPAPAPVPLPTKLRNLVLPAVVPTTEEWRDDPNGMVFMPAQRHRYLDTSPAPPGLVAPGRENIPQEGIVLARPFERFKLRLGRAADVDAYWKGEPPAGHTVAAGGPFFSPAFTIERYAHRIVQGRDAFVEVVYKGFLFPLGIRAALVKLTRREFHRYQRKECGSPTAYLVQELFIVVNKPHKNFKAYGQPNEGRDFPCSSVTMLTTQTGSLMDPDPFNNDVIVQKDLTRPYGADVGTVFWPRLAGTQQDVTFAYQIDDRPEPAYSRLLFVDNAAAHDPDTMRWVVESYSTREHAGRREVTHHGAVRRYGAEKKPGECSFPTASWTLAARGRLGADEKTEYFHMDAFMEGQDQPPFYPVMDLASMTVKPIARFTGKADASIKARFNPNYVRNGFDTGRNPSGLYLDVVSAPPELNANESQGAGGGIAGVAFLVGGISPNGPVGGRRIPTPPAKPGVASATARLVPTVDTSESEAGRFATPQFLDGAIPKTKLFNLILLSDLVKACLIAAAPKLVETVNHGIQSAAQGVEEIAREMQELLAVAVGKVQAALSSARTEIEKGLADISPAGMTLTLKDLYGGFAKALDDLDAALAHVAGLGASDTLPNLAQLQEAADRLKSSVDGLLHEMASIARDPVPTVVKEAIIKVRSFLDDLRTPLKSLEKLLGELLKKLIDEAVAQLLQEACNATAGIDMLPLLFGEDPDSPAPTCAARIDSVSKLLRNPADALPRLQQAVLYEVFSGPLLKVIGGLNGAMEKLPLLWSREVIITALGTALRRGVSEVPASVFTAPLNAAVAELEEALGQLPKQPRLIPAFIEQRARAALVRQQAALAASLDAYLKTHVTKPLAEVKVDIRTYLLEEANKLITPEMRLCYEKLVILKHRLESLDKQVRQLAALLTDEARQKALFEEMAEAVRAECMRALDQQIAQAKEKAEALVEKGAERLLASAADVFDMLLQWQGMRVLNQRAIAVADGVNRHLVALDILTARLFADKAVLDATLRDFDYQMLEAVRLLGEASMRGAPPALQQPLQQLTGVINHALVISAGVRLDLDRLEVSRRNWAKRAGLDLKLAAEIVSQRAHLLAQGRTILAQMLTIGDQLGALSALGLGDLKSTLDGVRSGVVKALKAHTIMLADLSLVRGPGDAAALWDTLKQYLADLQVPVTEELDKAIGKAAGDLITLKAVADGAVADALRLSQSIGTVLDEQLHRAEAEMLSRLVQAAAPAAAFFARIETVFNVMCGHLATALLAPHQKVLALVTAVITYLKQGSANSNAAAAALIAQLAQKSLKDLETVLKTLERDIGQIEELAKGGQDALKAVEHLRTAWKGRQSGLILAVELVGRIVTIVTAGNLSTLFDVRQLEEALAEAVRSFIPTKVSLRYDFETALTEFPAGDPIFAMDRASYGTARERDYLERTDGPANPVHDLTLNTLVQVDLLSGERAITTEGRLRPFALHLLGNRLDLLTIYFAGARFHAKPGQSMRFDTQIADVKIGAMLSFLTEIQKYFGSGKGNGVYYQLRFGPPEIEVGYRYSKPLIQVGTLQLINLGFHIGARLPLGDRQAEFFFSLSTRELPFLIAQPPYIGGGFFALRATAAGVIAFEIQLEFGFGGAIEMGPLNAQARATVGIYLMSGAGRRVLEGFFHVVGSGTLGCFGVGVNMEIRTRQEDDGAMAGSATYEYSIKVGFFEMDFQVQTGHRQENGQDSGERMTAPQLMRSTAADGPLRKRRLASAAAARNDEVHAGLLVSKTIDKHTKWKAYTKHFDI